jgi:hypothetical protein
MNIKDLMELIQDDLLTLLDDLSEELKNNACQIVVDRCKEYLEANEP